MPQDAVRHVTDEATCERAAKAYDSYLFSGSVLLEEHTALSAVLVVAIGDMLLVDDLSDRDGFWNVMLFDKQWEPLSAHGGGA